MRSIHPALLVSLCLPLIASDARAQELHPDSAPDTARAPTTTATDQPTAQPTDQAAEKKRVLHLASGQSIRVVSRYADGRWEYKGKGGWKALQPGSVVSVALESDLVKQWRARRAALDTRNCDDRAALAAWAARAGLMQEALTEIDAVLMLEPDNAAALELLERTWFFTVPSLQVEADALAAAEDELLRFGASQSPAGRELAAMQLARHPDRAKLKVRIASELRSSVVTRRSFAALAMRRVFPGEDIKPLMARAVLDASADVRKGCALALKAAAEPGLIVPIVRALDSRSLAVRVNAAEALGHMGYAAAVEPLMMRMAVAQSSGSGERLPHSHIFVGRQFAYIQDFDVEVAQFQAVADPQINVLIEGSVLDAAVSGEMVVSFAEESRAIQGSLSKLTNEKPGHTAAAWLAWWEKNGAKWRAEDLSRPKTGTTDAGKG